MLGDDQEPLPVDAHFFRPLLGMVIFLAVDEHHHVRVLFDRARLAQVRQTRPMIFASVRFHLPIQLGQNHDRDLKLAGKRLQPPAHSRHLLLARKAGILRLDQLQIVDDEKPEALCLAQAPRQAPKSQRPCGLVCRR